MTLGDAIYSLRAIRRHRPEPIPDDDITAILDAAIQAPNGANTVKGLAAANSIIPSVQNLLLAARCLGIGSTITTLHPSVEERVHALFEIPETAQVVYCLPLGYPKGNFGPVTRQPLEKVSSRNRWGSTAS